MTSGYRLKLSHSNVDVLSDVCYLIRQAQGRSWGLPLPYTAAQLASDLSRLLDHLGIGSTAVLGYSHGGAIAQQLVLDHSGLCDRLVLAARSDLRRRPVF